MVITRSLEPNRHMEYLWLAICDAHCCAAEFSTRAGVRESATRRLRTAGWRGRNRGGTAFWHCHRHADQADR